MWFKLDINKLVILLTPTFLRQKRFLAWIKALHSPLTKVIDDFNENRKQNLYNLAHNGQVCHLRAALNDRFDVSQRRIKITEGNRYKRPYIYTDAEKKPKYLSVIYLRDDADYGDTGVDFIVQVPTDLVYNDYEIRALIDFYKLASKRYKIEKY